MIDDVTRPAANRYGAGDDIGALNELSEGTVLAALRLVRHGRRFCLARPLDERGPNQMWRYWKQISVLDHVLPERAVGSNQQSFMEDIVSGAVHSGTHIDGLGHVGRGDTTYNGLRYGEIISSVGLTQLGIDKMPPIVTRGLLLDVSKLDDTDRLGPARPISDKDLRAVCAAQGLSPKPGDVVLVHTGWGALWDEDPLAYRASEPGLTVDAAQWLTDRRVSVIGADNWAVEAVPGVEATQSFPVHQHCLVDTGTLLLENVVTEELVSSGVSEFCCVILPLRLTGASGSMVSPLAIA